MSAPGGGVKNTLGMGLPYRGSESSFPPLERGVILTRRLVADLHAKVDAVDPQFVLDEEGATGCWWTPC